MPLIFLPSEKAGRGRGPGTGEGGFLSHSLASPSPGNQLNKFGVVGLIWFRVSTVQYSDAPKALNDRQLKFEAKKSPDRKSGDFVVPFQDYGFDRREDST